MVRAEMACPLSTIARATKSGITLGSEEGSLCTNGGCPPSHAKPSPCVRHKASRVLSKSSASFPCLKRCGTTTSTLSNPPRPVNPSDIPPFTETSYAEAAVKGPKQAAEEVCLARRVTFQVHFVSHQVFANSPYRRKCPRLF
jgi:hypothetical protein